MFFYAVDAVLLSVVEVRELSFVRDIVFWWCGLEFFFFIGKWVGIVSVIEAVLLEMYTLGIRFIVSSSIVGHD
jgi:hypothetical protein